MCSSKERKSVESLYAIGSLYSIHPFIISIKQQVQLARPKLRGEGREGKGKKLRGRQTCTHTPAKISSSSSPPPSPPTVQCACSNHITTHSHTIPPSLPPSLPHHGTEYAG